MPVNAKQILAAVALTVLGTLACEMLAELYERRFHPEDYETASEPAPAQAEEPGPTEIEEADSPLVMEFTVNGEARELAVHKVKETFFTYRTDETPLTEPHDAAAARRTVRDSKGRLVREATAGGFTFCEYDGAGRLSRETESPTEERGDWTVRRTLGYDKGGRLVSERTERRGEDGSAERRLEYGEDGRLAMERLFGADGRCSLSIERGYDADGNEISAVSRNADGIVTEETRTDFGADGKSSHTVSTGAGGRKLREEWVRKDGQGNAVYRKITDPYMTAEEINENKYTEDGSLEFQKHYEKYVYLMPTGTKEYEQTRLTKFGENGSFRSKIKATPTGSEPEEREVVALYDERGRLVYEKNPDGSPDGYEAWFEYDGRGNETYLRDSLGGRTREFFTEYSYYLGGKVKRATVYSTSPDADRDAPLYAGSAGY